ncbi:MAG: tetratricopeptide repeat protein [Planctomycetota bacterium]
MSPEFDQNEPHATAEILFQEALIFLNQNQIIRAMNSLNQAVELDPEKAEAYYHLGRIHLELSETLEAIIAFSQAIVKKSDYGEALEARGDAYLDRGDRQKGKADYLRVLEIFPEKQESLLKKINTPHREKSETQKIVLDLKLETHKLNLNQSLEAQRKHLLQKKFGVKHFIPKGGLSRKPQNLLNLTPEIHSNQKKQIVSPLRSSKRTSSFLRSKTGPSASLKKMNVAMALLVFSGLGYFFFKGDFLNDLSENSISLSSRFSINSKQDNVFPSLIPIEITQSQNTRQFLDQLTRFSLVSSKSLKKELSKTLSFEELLFILKEPELKIFHVSALETLAIKGIPKEYTSELEKIIDPYLSSPKEQILMAAISVASFLPQKSNQLLTYCESDFPLKIREHALKSASWSAPQNLLPVLLNYIQKPLSKEKEDIKLRRAAVYGLRFYSEEKAVNALIETLSQSSDFLVKEAIDSLIIQAYPERDSFILAKLKTADFRLQRNIYKVLSECPTLAHLPILEKGLSSSSDSIQYLSALGISQINSKTTLPVLCKQILEPQFERKYKLMILEKLSENVFLKQTRLEGDQQLEPLFIQLCEKTQDPLVKLACMKRIYALPFAPLKLFLDLLQPQNFSEATQISDSELNRCKMEAWQLLMRATNQQFPPEKELWQPYLLERDEETK